MSARTIWMHSKRLGVDDWRMAKSSRFLEGDVMTDAFGLLIKAAQVVAKANLGRTKAEMADDSSLARESCCLLANQ